jgi:hypothetical protein
MYSIVGQHKALPLLARASGKNIRLQRFAYADLTQLGADPNGTYLSAKKIKTSSSRAVARRSFARSRHPEKDCFIPRNDGRVQISLK